MLRRSSRWLPGLVALALLALAGAPWPDDWDAAGFVLAVTDWDLARLQPHPPGYPVYVALARALHAAGASAVRACTLASALGGALCVLALARAAGFRALVALAAPALVLAATSARSDALGLGLVALGVAVGAGDRARDITAGGALLALGLGARPSYAVLVASALVAGAVRHRRRALPGALAFAAVCALWAAGLALASGGAARYLALARAQAEGHFTAWGGSALTRPGWSARALAAARAVLADGLGLDASWWGAARAVAWAALAARGATRCGRRAAWLVALAAPYAAWAWAAQNVAESPRHLLPVVLALLALASEGLPPPRVTPLAAGVGALALLLALPALAVALAHRAQPPPGVAIARWVRARAAARDAVVFGGRSARLVAWAGVPAVPVTVMGSADVALARFDRLPRAVFVTSEVQLRERARGTLGRPTRFCRDPRLDRARACVAVQPYDVLAVRP